jgi:2-succinyl-5-enolpyruvyl-6-hydroxy-3-cyclohexene-1-carboxylate synthase
MKIPKIPLAQTVILLCKAKGIKHIVISPGSRSAPLTIGFTNDPFFKCYSIVDERSAAFFALGIAQQIKHPVALVCTSGSALLNYFPAVAEAFYSDIPLVVLSADRPQYLVGIGDGQTIDQKDVYGNHVLYSANLKLDLDTNNKKEINKALNLAIANSGPVHLNCPFEEPLYETVEEHSIEVKVVENNLSENTIAQDDLDELLSIWNKSERIMLLVGVLGPCEINDSVINNLVKDDRVLVFTETTSNLSHEGFFPCIDKIIAPLDTKGFQALQPDLLLTFGGIIVSKKIKAYLRKHQPRHHWHIDTKKANDTFFCLDKHLCANPNEVLGRLLELASKSSEGNYKQHWNNIKEHREERHHQYLESIPFCDLKVFDKILASLPKNSNLQLGNSSTIRYAQLFSNNPTLKIFCNRGTSGIDGSTSTAIGAASISKERTTLVTGDLSFLYDSNALWNEHIPKDFRIIIINNNGGGIFRILPGEKNSSNFDKFFETTHELNGQDLCNMYGIE